MNVALLTLGIFSLSSPIFQSEVIHDQFDSNSYWITSSSLSSQELPSIVFGSCNGDIHLYYEGKVSIIAHLNGSVHGVLYDVNDDGHKDLIVAHKFGMGCPFNCQPEDGHLSWLENPKDAALEWKLHDIGKPAYPGHRIFVANTALDRSFHRLISVPIAAANLEGLGEFSPFHISSYKVPDTIGNEWVEERLEKIFTVCHEGKPFPSNDGFSLSCSMGEIFYKATEIPDHWDISYPIDPISFQGEKYTGTSSSALLSADKIAFIAPFHGGHVGVSQGNFTIFLDEFEFGGHDIQSAQFLSAPSMSQFIVAIRGTPRSGIYFYAINDNFNITHKIRVYTGTPSMLTLDDFDGDGRIDFASIDWGPTNSSAVIIHYNLSD